MSATKRALLIASPFGGLRGPLNDVDRMTTVLRARGFDITQCCGQDATRDGIRTKWRDLIAKSSAGDTVAIFYSGHGGLVESPQRKPQTENEGDGDGKTPRQYQFIVPIDYGETKDGDFRGILHVELSHLLRDTTNKTVNVTVILDCCHSGRMARDATHGKAAAPKQLLEVQHHDIAKWVEILKQDGYLRGETDTEGNRAAVRIAACATRETAWEYRRDGQWGGVMTEALVRALDEAEGCDISWRTLFIRVGELVQVEFPQQHPRVEGLDTRQCFSLDSSESRAFLVTMEDGTAVLQAGRVAGVREANTYAVMPFGSTESDKRSQIAEATVTHIIGFKARVELKFKTAGERLPGDGALAFLCQEALYEWPAILPEGLPGLEAAVQSSNYLRRHNHREDPSHLVEFRQEAGRIAIHTERGAQIASRQIPDDQTASTQVFGEIMRDAEILAKAQHLLSLRCENSREFLSHRVKVEFGTVHEGGTTRPINQDGSGSITERDSVYVSLQNTGAGTVYVSVFDVNVAGRISLVSSSSPTGIELQAGHSYTIGMDQFGAGLKGLPATWPESVPKIKRIDEQLVFVLSNLAVDLRHLESSAASATRLADLAKRSPSLEGLEEVTYRLASGRKRDVVNKTRSYTLHYDIFHIPFSMSSITGGGSGESEQRSVPAAELPEPETTEEWKSLPTYPPHMAERGVFGAGLRAFQGIPPCVWVVNQHAEDITVVISKYRPNRLLSGGGLNASSTGGGLNYTTTTFLSPATTKVLAPWRNGFRQCMAAFPLWTRKEEFGVISVFTGPEKKLFIENDMIPIGATAYFRNEPDLTIVGFKEKHIDVPLPGSTASTDRSSDLSPT